MPKAHRWQDAGVSHSGWEAEGGGGGGGGSGNKRALQGLWIGHATGQAMPTHIKTANNISMPTVCH